MSRTTNNRRKKKARKQRLNRQKYAEILSRRLYEGMMFVMRAKPIQLFKEEYNARAIKKAQGNDSDR